MKFMDFFFFFRKCLSFAYNSYLFIYHPFANWYYFHNRPLPRGTPVVVSTCSDLASSRGSGQKVVSYSYYSPTSDLGSQFVKRYLGQMWNRSVEVKEKYPGWVMRIYFWTTFQSEVEKSALCRIYCEQAHVDFCDVNDLPSMGNNS